VLGVPQLRSYDDVARLGEEVRHMGFKAHPFQGLLAWARTRAVATCSRATAAST
jgi:hypothetical protein